MGEAESLVVTDGREEAGATEKRSFECRRQWRAAAQSAATHGQERVRERVEERVWQWGRRRARSGAPGGRPGGVHPSACAPRGGRTLPACHDVAAWPSARVDAALARGGGDARAGWAGFGQWASGLLAPPFPFFYFL